MTTTEDIQKAVKEIEERKSVRITDSQMFADLKALIYATKALLSSAAVDRDVIQRQAAMIEELTASNTLLLRQRDTWQAECERLQSVVASMSAQIAAITAERDRMRAFVDWVAAYPCPSEIQTICAFKNCEKCIRTKARDARGRE